MQPSCSHKKVLLGVGSWLWFGHSGVCLNHNCWQVQVRPHARAACRSCSGRIVGDAAVPGSGGVRQMSSYERLGSERGWSAVALVGGECSRGSCTVRGRRRLLELRSSGDGSCGRGSLSLSKLDGLAYRCI